MSSKHAAFRQRSESRWGRLHGQAGTRAGTRRHSGRVRTWTVRPRLRPSTVTVQQEPRVVSSQSKLQFWKLGGSPYDGEIMNLAVPAVLALAADPLLGIIDTAFVGRLGDNHLAALGVNTSLFSLSFVVFNFLATATAPMVAAAVSARQTRQAGETVWQAGAMALVLGVAVELLLITNSGPLLGVMGVDASQTAVLPLASEYLAWRALAAPAVLLMTVGQGVFRGMQNMRVPLAITLVTNIIHLALDPLLIFNMHMGLKGAAISTMASEWLAAGCYGGLVWRERGLLGLWPPPQLDWAQAKERYLPFCKAGGAILLRTGALLSIKTMATAVAMRLGPSSVASHQVLMQLWVLTSMVVDSLAVSGQTLVAVALGRGRTAEARAVSERLLQLGLGAGVLLAVAIEVGSPWWPEVFTDDAGLIGQIRAILPLAVLPLPVNAMVYTLDGVLVGASDFRYLMNAMAVASAGAAVLLFSVEPLHLGLEGVWAALVLLMVGRLATLGLRFQSLRGPLPPVVVTGTGDSSSGGSGSGRESMSRAGTADGGSSSSSMGSGADGERTGED